MTNKEYSILSSFLMRSLFFGPAIYSILHIAKQNGWISIILSFILSFIPLILYYLLFNLDKKKNIIDINNDLGLLGKLFNLIFILFITFHASLVLWNLTNFIYSQFLFQTPLFIISLIFIIGILYMSFKNITFVARAGTIFFIINVILFLTAALTLIGKTDFSLLKPFLNEGLKPVFKGIIPIIGLNVLPLFILLIFSKDDINGNIFNPFLKVYSFTYLAFFLIIIVSVSIFGINLTNLYQYPEFHILKTINIANFFQRVESILSVQWIFDSVMSCTICVYFTKTAIIKTFKFNKKIILNIILVTIILFLTNYIFQNNTIALNFYMSIYPYLSIIILFFIPLLIYILKKVSK